MYLIVQGSFTIAVDKYGMFYFSANETDSMMSGSETEIENEDLSEVRAGSAILPNLTIAIERDDDPGFEIW